MIKTCEGCLYEDKRQCRRLPPSTVPWPMDNQHPIMYQPMTTWPIINVDDWCGEYKEKELSR